MPERTLVIGVGNELRGDDGAGVAVARRLRRRGVLADGVEVLEHQAEPTGLLDTWRGAGAVVVVDAMRSGSPPGTMRRFDARHPLPVRWGGSSSTHAFALGEAIELGRALGRLPARLVVFAVEGLTFAAGAELSADLQQAVPVLADAVWLEAVRLSRRAAD